MAKKFFSKALSVGLSLALCAGMVAPAFAASFSELNNAIQGGTGGTDMGGGRYGYGDKLSQEGEDDKYAIEAWDQDDTRHVQLNEDVNYGEKGDTRTGVTVSEGKVELDLNGQNIVGKENSGMVISVAKGAELTIKGDVPEEGEEPAEPTDPKEPTEPEEPADPEEPPEPEQPKNTISGGSYGVYSQGDLTLNGVTVKDAKYYDIYNYQGEVEVKNSTLTGAKYGIYNNSGKVSVKDSDLSGNSGDDRYPGRRQYSGVYSVGSGTNEVTLGGTIRVDNASAFSDFSNVVTIIEVKAGTVVQRADGTGFYYYPNGAGGKGNGGTHNSMFHPVKEGDIALSVRQNSDGRWYVEVHYSDEYGSSGSIWSDNFDGFKLPSGKNAEDLIQSLQADGTFILPVGTTAGFGGTFLKEVPVVPGKSSITVKASDIGMPEGFAFDLPGGPDMELTVYSSELEIPKGGAVTTEDGLSVAFPGGGTISRWDEDGEWEFYAPETLVYDGMTITAKNGYGVAMGEDKTINFDNYDYYEERPTLEVNGKTFTLHGMEWEDDPGYMEGSLKFRLDPEKNQLILEAVEIESGLQYGDNYWIIYPEGTVFDLTTGKTSPESVTVGINGTSYDVTPPEDSKLTVDEDGTITLEANGKLDRYPDGVTKSADGTIRFPASDEYPDGLTVYPNNTTYPEDIEVPEIETTTTPYPNGAIIYPDGTIVSTEVVDNGDGTKTVITTTETNDGEENGEVKTTVTIPEGKEDEVNTTPDSTTTLPGGSKVTGEDGNETTYPNGTTIDKDGNVNGDGTDPSITKDKETGDVTIDDGKGGTTEVEVPDGGNADVKVNDDGTVTVTVPEGGKITDKDGNEIDLPDGGEIIIDKDGNVTLPKVDDDDDDDNGGNNNGSSNVFENYDFGAGTTNIEDEAVPLAGIVFIQDVLAELYRRAGSPDGADAEGEYDRAVAWALANELIDDETDVEAVVTVAALRAILANYAKVFGANAVAAEDLTTLTGEDDDVVMNCDEVLAEFFGEEYVPAKDEEETAA